MGWQALDVTPTSLREDDKQRGVSMGRTLMTEQVRESMEQVVRTSTQQDSRTSTQQDTQLLTQQTTGTSTQQRTLRSTESVASVLREMTSVVGASAGQEEEGVVDKRASAQDLHQDSGYFQASAQTTTQESQQSTQPETVLKSRHSPPRRTFRPSLAANLTSAAPTMTKQYAVATSPTSLRGFIKDAVVTLTEAVAVSDSIRGSGREAAGTRVAAEEGKPGRRQSEGETKQTTTEAAQKEASSSQEILQMATGSVPRDELQRNIVRTVQALTTPKENSPSYSLVAENEQLGRETMVSSTGQTFSGSTIQRSTETTSVSASYNAVEATSAAAQIGGLMGNTIDTAKHKSEALSSTAAEERLDHDVTSEHGSSIQTFNAKHSLSAEMYRVQANDSTQNIERSCEHLSLRLILIATEQSFQFRVTIHRRRMINLVMIL